MSRAHAVTDIKHQEANERRHRLAVVAMGAAALSALIVFAAWRLDALPFLVGADNFVNIPSGQVALLVALGGMVGGCWGAFPALMGGRRDRFRTYYASAAARLMLGVLAALIGVSLVGAGWVESLTASSAPALFAVAIAFGATQEPLIRILETKVSEGNSQEQK